MPVTGRWWQNELGKHTSRILASAPYFGLFRAVKRARLCAKLGLRAKRSRHVPLAERKRRHQWYGPLDTALVDLVQSVLVLAGIDY